ncbi:hypothetical protein [Kitasatospora sp. NPDC059327]|uniref:hypothetical protein n=1 Tax=Kitasatospora sp. NPDC059327 TaxID=3346803 RepID=UPI0036A58408
MRIEKTAGKDTGRMDFTDYDKPLTVQAPPADGVPDFGQVQGPVQDRLNPARRPGFNPLPSFG